MERPEIVEQLLALLATGPDRANGPGVQHLSTAGWEDLLELAADQKVTPMLYHGLLRRGLEGSVPDDVWQSLRQAYLTNARKNWLLGLGAWGRANVEGLAADALWMILAATYGLLGLISFMIWWMGNIVDAWRHAPRWAPDVRQVAALWATLSGLLAVDFLVNGFPSPAMIIGAGGVCAVSAATADARRIRASRVRKRRAAASTKAAVHPPVGSPHARTP